MGTLACSSNQEARSVREHSQRSAADMPSRSTIFHPEPPQAEQVSSTLLLYCFILGDRRDGIGDLRQLRCEAENVMLHGDPSNSCHQAWLRVAPFGCPTRRARSDNRGNSSGPIRATLAVQEHGPTGAVVQQMQDRGYLLFGGGAHPGHRHTNVTHTFLLYGARSPRARRRCEIDNCPYTELPDYEILAAKVARRDRSVR